MHPFSEIVVLLPEDVPHPGDDTFMNADDSSAMALRKKKDDDKDDKEDDTVPTIRYVSRNGRHDWDDLCTAPIKSTWFLFTNSYHRVRETLHVMTTEVENGEAGRKHVPLASYIKATDESCFDFDSCRQNLEFIQEHVKSDMTNIYQDFDLVFENRLRRRYCRYWKRVTEEASARVGAVSGSDTNMVPPSATSYMAYLQTENLLNGLYSLSDRGIYGSRPPFLPLPNSMLPPSMQRVDDNDDEIDDSYGRNRHLQGNNINNQTDCTLLATATECVLSDKPCLWQPNFSSCTDVRNNNNNVGQAIGSINSNIGPPRDHRPNWLAVLIGIGLAGGLIAVIGLLAVGVRQTFQYYFMEHVHFPVYDHSLILDDDVDACGSMSAHASGGGSSGRGGSHGGSARGARGGRNATAMINANSRASAAAATPKRHNQYHNPLLRAKSNTRMEEINLNDDCADGNGIGNNYRFSTFANHYSCNELYLSHPSYNTVMDTNMNNADDSCAVASDSSGGRSGTLGYEVVNTLLNSGHFEQTWENSVEYVRNDTVDL